MTDRLRRGPDALRVRDLSDQQLKDLFTRLCALAAAEEKAEGGDPEKMLIYVAARDAVVNERRWREREAERRHEIRAQVTAVARGKAK